MMRVNTRYQYLVPSVILLAAIVYLGTFRAGHNWGGDFAQYLLHARQILGGQPYSSLPIIHTPSNSIAPLAAPPGLPCVLAPVVALWGIQLTVLKVYMVGWFFLGVIMFWRVLIRHATPREQWLTMTLLLANPVFWNYKDAIMTSHVFVPLVYAALLCFERGSTATTRRDTTGWAIVTGLVMALAYATRTTGLMLVPCICLYEWIHQRHLTRMSLVPVLCVVCAVAVQNMWVPVEASYMSQLIAGRFWTHVGRNLLLYPYSTYNFWGNGYSHVLMWGVWAVMNSAVLMGYIFRARQHISIYEIFFVMYILPILIWEYQGIRYLVPIIPLYFFYAVVGLQRLARARWVIPAIMSAVLVSYAGTYTTEEHGAFTDGVGTPQAVAFLNHVRGHTPEDAVIIFRKPRVMALMTSRVSSIFPLPISYGSLMDHATLIEATHIALMRHIPEDQQLQQLLDARPQVFQQVYGSRQYAVYRIVQARPSPMAP
jgi:hypothetical protein